MNKKIVMLLNIVRDTVLGSIVLIAGLIAVVSGAIALGSYMLSSDADEE